MQTGESPITDTLPKRRRSRAVPVFILALVLLVAGGLAWRATRVADTVEVVPAAAEATVAESPEAETAGNEPAPKEPVVDKPATEEPLIEESSKQEAESATAKPKRKAPPAAVAPASLTVIVYPWGDVWINGKPRGSAPLKGLPL